MKKKKLEKIISNGVFSIFESRINKFPLAKDFIIFFQPLAQIAKLKKNTSKNNVVEELYPICRSFYMIDNYALVVYVKATDIIDLNTRYAITTSYPNKIKNFNNIINLLIAHLNKSSINQELFFEKLNIFLSTLNDKQGSLEYVFDTPDFLQFIEENQHLILKIIKFIESLKMETIPNCSIQKNKNLNQIKGLNSLMKVYPFYIQSFHLKNDPITLELNLYIFFSKFNHFSEHKKLNLKNINTLLLFFELFVNEKNLEIDIFTDNFIKILKNTNNKC